MKYLLGLALLVSAAAQSDAPVANLVLACPDKNAVGQPGLDSCRGYVYQLLTNERIVASGSTQTHFWRRAGDLIGADTVLVCTIPVQPGRYSSCRDPSGVRRTAFVRKDSMAGGSVTVSKTGGDYTDPVTAAQHAFAGDTWCVAPLWPTQPCVIAMGDGVFILHETLSIPQGLVVAGAGKGATMLVADNGVETAVTSFGNARLSDLRIVNSQLGGARAIGLDANAPPHPAALAQLHNVGIHATGAAQNVAVIKNNSLDILDSEITAAGEDASGISSGPGPDLRANLRLERSRVSATEALNEDSSFRGDMRLIDSQIFGSVRFNNESSLLEILRSAIIGNVTAQNDWVRVVIRDSSIQGDLNPGHDSASGMEELTVVNTSFEGYVGVTKTANALFDGLQLRGELAVVYAGAKVVRSYLAAESTSATAVSLGGNLPWYSGHLQLEQTFVQGALALSAVAESRLESFSSVLAGPISPSGTAALRCTDTYGADYELLNASCEPQPP